MMLRRTLAIRVIDKVKKALSSRHVLWLVPAITMGLLAFGLDVGWLIDDHMHRAALTHHPDLPELHRSPESLFAFIDSDPQELSQLTARGIWPWWSASELRLAFWRPVAGWTHALDYRAWPESPRLMHLHSIAWYLLAVVLLLMLFRQVLPRPAIAGLAGLLFAIDDSQALPALWLANRNAILALAFGVAALLAHDRWRRGGWQAGAIVGPLLLLTAVLANEGAVAIGGYLLAYAIYLDPAPWRSRLAALFPSVGVGLAWAVVYKIGGYGALGSGIYIDPVAEPLRFAATASVRAPLMLWGWWGFPPSDISIILPDATLWRRLLVVLALLAFLGWLLRPILRREAAARFFGLGMLLALVPASSTFPSNRLLGFVGIGAAGLLALLIAELAATTSTVTKSQRWGRRTVLASLVAVHLIAAPLLIRPYLGQMQLLERMVRRTASSLIELADSPQGLQADDPDAKVIIVATPSAFISLTSTVVATLVKGWHPRPNLVLSSTIYGTEVTRPDNQTLIVRPRGGFLRGPGAPTPAGFEHSAPNLDPRKSLLMLDHLFRDLHNSPFQVGDRLDLDGVTLEIIEVEEGRPLTVACRFSESLESDRWLWLAWRNWRYEKFPLPAVGDTVTWPGLYKP